MRNKSAPVTRGWLALVIIPLYDCHLTGIEHEVAQQQDPHQGQAADQHQIAVFGPQRRGASRASNWGSSMPMPTTPSQNT